MADDDKVLKVITRLESDQQAANKTKADIERQQQALQQLEQRQEALSAVENRARNTELQLAQARQAAQRETRDSREEVDRATQALRDYEEASERAAAADQRRAQATTRGGRFGGAAESVDRASSVGSQVLSGLGQGEAANAAGLIGDLAGAFTSLNPVMLAVTAVGAGVALVFSDIQQQMERTREQAEMFAKQQVENADLVASGATREDVLQRINNLRGASDFITGQLEQLNDLRQQWDDVTDSAFGFGSAIEIMTDPEKARQAEAIAKAIETITRQPVENITQLDEQIRALTEEGNAYQLSIANLQQLVKSGALTANDAAAAAQALAEADRKRSEAQAAEQLAAANQAMQIDRMTATQREERIRQNERDVNVLTRLIGEGGLSEEALKDLADQITKLNADTTALSAVTESYADTVERARQATEYLKEGADQVLDATTRYVEARQAAFEADQRYIEGLEQQQRNIDRINADLQEKERALDAQAAAAQMERERKLGIDRAKVAEEMQERILAAEERAGREFGNARARRDVLAAIAADQQRKDEQALAAKDAERRLDDLKDSAAEQERVERLRSEESLRNARQTADRARAVENEKARTEIAIRAQAAQFAIAQVTNTQQALLAIEQDYGNRRIQAARDAAAAGSAPYPTTKVVSTGATKQANIVIQATSQASLERQVVKTLKKAYS